MKYRRAQIDKDILNWFKNDKSANLLHSISIKNGSIRGVENAKWNCQEMCSQKIPKI